MISIDTSILQMALIGYESERQKIEERIAEIEHELGRRPGRATVPGGATAGRRLSAAAIAHIAAAQRKRWAAFHKEHGTTAPGKKTRGGKHKLSAAGRKAIAEATKKRWAAYRAKKAGAKRPG